MHIYSTHLCFSSLFNILYKQNTTYYFATYFHLALSLEEKSSLSAQLKLHLSFNNHTILCYKDTPWFLFLVGPYGWAFRFPNYKQSLINLKKIPIKIQLGCQQKMGGIRASKNSLLHQSSEKTN